MQKKLGYFSIALAVLVVLLVVFRYCTGLSAPTTIPVNATKVLQVNLRQLEKDIVLDVLGHPLKYVGKRKKRADSIRRKLKSLTKGVAIPKALYFYTSVDYPGWNSVEIHLSNQQIFTEFLEKAGFKQVANNDDVLVFSQQQVHFYLYGDTFIIGVSKKPLREHGRALFQPKEVLTSQDPMIQALINTSADLVMISDQGDLITGDFGKGVFELSGKLSDHFDSLLVVDRLANTDGLIDLNMRLNSTYFDESLTEDKPLIKDFEKFTHLSVDSILPNLNGQFALRLNAVVSVLDTIVTYSYDDDFNKVETRSLQRETVPEFGVNIGLKKQASLTDYFTRTAAIQVIEGKPVFTPIPLYTFYAKQLEDEFVLYTGELPSIQQTQPTKFYCKFRVHEYLQRPLDIPIPNQFREVLTLISQLELEVTQANEVRGKVELLNTYRNFIAQLIRP